ncbi:uncharacterized protein A1O9_05520 [Exophiala aquamarina CBS 119918]|uniref:Chromatin modification-related protein EAF3 n=1 Tax=Exophiala aquamarina CBS 119918 TaxID=1182545 RepID=A0A072PCU4_9EURO|nr:uncharacterized protein A1O9_05520 [Exophiala aquamarina CBS 119918]KEF57602.1 hypothetical protein A1O9_05520 [Exophiala aquamarina CBS 119918]
MAPQSSESKPMYQKDEKALCFHGELLYEAKVLEIKRQDPKDKNSHYEYYVHYKGWKNTWDDWVSQDRLRKLTDDNRELAANLRREAVAQNAPKPVTKSLGKTRRGQGSELGSGRGSEERTSSIPTGGARGSKRARDNDIEKVGGPYQFPTPWNHISGILDEASDQDDVGPPVLTKPRRPIKTTLTVKPEGMAKDKAQDSVPNKRLDLSSFIHVPRKAAVKASGVLSSAGSMGPPASGLQTRARKPKEYKGSAKQLSSEDNIMTPALKRAKRAENPSITKPNDEKRIPESFPSTFMSPSPLNQGPQKGSPSITTSTVKSSHGNVSKRRRVGTSRDNSASTSTRRRTMADPHARDEAYWTAERQQQMQTELVDEILARPAPPDEPEQFSKNTARQRDKQHFAPLIGSTTMQEKAMIEDELGEAGNFNKKLFYQGVAPDRLHEIAVVDADPLVIDPPGSGGPFDALKFPDRLVQQLNRDDADTLIGWDETALLKIPKKLMEELHPHILAKMPFNVLLKLPFTIQEKLPNNHPFFGEQSRREEEAAAARSAAPRPARVLRSSTPATSSNANPPPMGNSVLQSTNARSTMSTMSQSSIFQPLVGDENLPPGGLLESAGNTPPTTFVNDQLEDEGPCTTCAAMGINCNRQKPICHCRTQLFDRDGNFITPGLDIFTYTGTSLQEENYQNRPSIRISIPDHLKNLLVDDWENVTKSLLLVPLPSQAPANFILDEYFNEEKTNRRLGSVEADILEEFCVGLKTYFEKAIGKILLYRFERSQLNDVRKLWESGKYKEWDGKGPGDCYGAEHLTRMIVNLPEIIAQTNMDAESVSRLKSELSKFSTWLSRNSGRFFCAKYEKPSAEYIESAR